MLSCPNCDRILVPLNVDTTSGGQVSIDQCAFCGGFWFDHYEINRVPLAKILTLSKADSHIQTANIPHNNECPKDHIYLKELRTEGVPPDVIIMQCPQCLGNFVSQKDLYRLKKAQKIKIDYFKAWKIPLNSITSVLIPLIVLFIITSGLFTTVINFRRNQSNRIKAQEIIARPQVYKAGENSVLISFTTNIPVTSSIIYRAESEKEPQTLPVSEIAKKNHVITLQNLKPGTTYSFKISIEEKKDAIITSSSYTFVTN